MDKIIIGFSRPKGWFEPFSWLIRLVTWSPYSHAYIRYTDSYTNRSIVFQASGLKVNFVGQAMFDSKEIVCEEFVIPISEKVKQKVIQNAVDICGSPYGIGQIFGIGYVLFMRLLDKKVKNPFASTSSDFCSEMVAEIIDEIGDGNLDASSMTPKDLCNWLIVNNFKTV